MAEAYIARLQRACIDEVARAHLEVVLAAEWSKTPMGPIAQWPAELRSAVATCLQAPTPMAFYWTKDLHLIYNQPYSLLLGPAKHPRLLGMRYSEGFSEIWSMIEPIMTAALSGRSTLFRDTRMLIYRDDSAKEGFFNGSFMPHYDGTGERILAVINPCTETTSTFVSQRRMNALHKLYVATATTEHIDAYWKEVVASLSEAETRSDLPYTVIYANTPLYPRDEESENSSDDGLNRGPPWQRSFEPLFLDLQDGKVRSHRPTSLERVSPALAAFPSRIALDVDAQATRAESMLQTAVSRVMSGESHVVLAAEQCRELFGDAQHPDWQDDTISRALVFSVGLQKDLFSTTAVVIWALNTRRDLDSAYADFMTVCASQIRAGLANMSSTVERVFNAQYRAWRAAQRALERLEHIRAEDAMKQQARTNNFVDLLSHEIRNPLAAVVSGVELLADRLDKIDVHGQPAMRGELDECMDELSTIDYSLGHIHRLVDQTLLLSKAKEGYLPIALGIFRPLTLVKDIMRTFAAEARKKMIDLTLELGEGMNKLEFGSLKSDAGRIAQILINLCSNAIQHTSSGRQQKIKVFADVTRDKPEYASTADDSIEPSSKNEEVYLRCDVSDTGRGLDEESQRVVWGRFQQGKTSPNSSTAGTTGLGLYFSQKMATLLGGSCNVRSTLGQGSTFSFFVACAPCKVEDARTVSNGGTTRSPSLVARAGYTKRATGIRLLVVEDNPTNQVVLKTQLTRAGYIVDTADDGQFALEKLVAAAKDAYYECCLMDHEMPRLNGAEATSKIRELESNGSLPGHLPILGVSANVRNEQVAAMLECGMDAVVPKPCKLDPLLAKIESLLSS